MSTLAEQIAAIPEPTVRELYAQLLVTAADDEDRIRALCKQVLPADVVDGDPHGAPTVVNLVEMLTNLVAAQRAR